jgi:uncharacterized protein YecT (DUF1311 family)
VNVRGTFCFCLVGFLLAGVQTAAAASKFSNAYAECMASGAAAQGVTVAMRECNDKELGRLNLKLNRVYAYALKRLSGLDEKKAFIQSERAWLTYMSAQCGLNLWDPGGTLGQVVADTCGMEMTADRIQFLQTYDTDH